MQKNPSIRFKGFTDAWEQRKFEEMLDKNDGVRRGPFGSSLKKEIFVENSDYVVYEQQNAIYDNYKTRYNISKEKFDELHKFSLKENDFIMSGAGTIGRISRVPKGIKPGVFNQALIRFRINSELTSPEYFLQFIRAENMQRKLTGANPGSAITNLVPMTEVKNWDIFVPAKAEQSKLGAFFNQLDNTIALHQRQLDNYKALKKVMLQKIFNQELRFKDQEGNNYPDWEKIALNELGETYTGLSGKTKENFGKGKGRFVTYMNVYSNPIADLAMTENVEIKDGENQNEVCYGDIFFTTSSETPEEVGMSSVWLSHESKVYLNSFCFGYRLSSRSEGVISPDFLGFQLRAPHIRKKIIFLAQGSTRFNISKSKLMDIVVYMPTIEEQNKITAFLLNVDSRIKHTIQSIERLNMLKKALLQQMFI